MRRVRLATLNLQRESSLFGILLTRECCARACLGCLAPLFHLLELSGQLVLNLYELGIRLLAQLVSLVDEASDSPFSIRLVGRGATRCERREYGAAHLIVLD